MKRRNFLQNILPLVSIPLVSNKIFASVLSPNSISPDSMALLAGDIDRILILVRLGGGNDGLNTVIPLDQYASLAHEKVRKSIVIPENKILKLNNNSLQGFHPSMTSMQNLYNEEKLCIVQGVANPEGVFSHFHGIDQWETTSTNAQIHTSGWIGRYLEKTYHRAPFGYPNNCMEDPFAIEVNEAPSTVIRGTGGTLGQGISSKLDGDLIQLLGNESDSSEGENMKRELAFIRQLQGHTIDYGNKINNAWINGSNSSVTYPTSVISSNEQGQQPTTISAQLKVVARLIKGGLKTRIFVVSMGNFDNHLNQVGQTGGHIGWHSWLLKDLSEAIGAFQKDAENLGFADRVIGMTYSEFGRRVVANEGLGTEHGYAAPMFLFGNAIKGGVIGSNFVVPPVDQITNSTNVTAQYDYKQVYKSVLQNWFGACDEDANDIIKTNVQAVPGIFRNDVAIAPCLMGPLVDPDSVACKGTVSVVDITGDDHNLYAKIYPNPSNGAFSIMPLVGFDSNCPIFINIMDVRGHVLMSEETRVNQGAAIEINRKFQPGMYIIRLQNKKYAISQKIVIHE